MEMGLGMGMKNEMVVEMEMEMEMELMPSILQIAELRQFAEDKGWEF